MKSYSLECVSPDRAAAALTQVLPGQRNPWLLMAIEGDPIAYFEVDVSEMKPDAWAIQVDISGRHFHRDKDVIAVLEKIQQLIGGEISREDYPAASET